MEMAAEAARRVNLPFVVVDMAQRVDGRWTVIEINDAQESGYAGVPRLAMWQRIVEIEFA
jgi:glutathione synthase/RimK-type ligase-like ATP-grasp enzyme